MTFEPPPSPDRHRSAAPRIAVACPGLGHIHRGIEAWALDLAKGLRRAGTAVDLYGGKAAPAVEPIGCFRRTEPASIRLAAVAWHLGGWRYGMGSPYEVEETSFAFNLWRRIRGTHDILHVQDPHVAALLDSAHKRGLSRARVIYANGTGEPAAVMRRFTHLQLLTPAAAAAWEPQRPSSQHLHTIPNFIDTDAFIPGDKAAARAALGLPADATILLCCAAIRRVHKRIDVLLRAFAQARRPNDNVLLVIAGGREPDSDAIMSEGKAALGDAVRFMVNVPRDEIGRLYRAADLFVMPSLFEMFGIVLIEALACGLPVLCNDNADFRYVVGPAGLFHDLTQVDGFAAALRDAINSHAYTALIPNARQHAVEHFSEPVVIRQITAMYGTTMRAAS